MSRQSSLHPATAATRVAVRTALRDLVGNRAKGNRAKEGLVLVALSGGADSLALAAAVAFEAPKLQLRAGAVIVDHQLQDGSDRVAARAAEQAAQFGLDPVTIQTVDVERDSEGGPESRARQARYQALNQVAEAQHALVVLTAHTRDDQAEQVLLGLARGSGTRSLAGIRVQRGKFLRPFLHPDAPTIVREQTLQACEAQGLTVWSDPHNHHAEYRRVRVRETVLPLMESELGPGIREALATTAKLLAQDADLLDDLTDQALTKATTSHDGDSGLLVSRLTVEHPAIATRMIRQFARAVADSILTAEQTRQIFRLVTHWKGQGSIDLPNLTVWRDGDRIWFQPRKQTR